MKKEIILGGLIVVSMSALILYTAHSWPYAPSKNSAIRQAYEEMVRSEQQEEAMDRALQKKKNVAKSYEGFLGIESWPCEEWTPMLMCAKRTPTENVYGADAYRGCIDVSCIKEVFIFERSEKNPNLKRAVMQAKRWNIHLVLSNKFEIYPGMVYIDANADDQEIIRYLTISNKTQK